METKVVSFEQMPELIQNLVERIEALEKTVREKVAAILISPYHEW